MTEPGGAQSYLLGGRENTFQRYRLFNEIYQPGTVARFADLDISPDLNILEIGCGIGDTACYMAKTLVPNGHVTAFDQAADLIELAKRQATELGLENITFICARGGVPLRARLLGSRAYALCLVLSVRCRRGHRECL